MPPRDGLIRQAIAPDAPGDKGLATQSVYESTRQAGHPLFRRVRPLPHASSTLTITCHHSIFLYNFVVVFNYSGGVWQGFLLYILAYVPMCTLTPRFILSIRELYARDVQGRRGEGIDSGFGLLATVGTAMEFADVEPNEGLEEGGDGMDTGTGLGSSSFTHGAVGPVIALADIGSNRGLENIEEVPVDVGATWPA